MKKALLTGLVVLAVILSGCGGGSTTVTLYSVGVMDGDALSNSALNSNPWGMTGDYGTAGFNSAYRVILTFNLGSIPAGATVTAATLKVYQTDIITGDDPYGLYGSVKVSHITFTDFVMGDGTLYNLAPISTFNSFLSISSASGWKTLDVTTAVQNDQANTRTYSQYRLFHENDNLVSSDNNEDSICWDMAETAGVNFDPQLEVTYTQ